MGCDIHIVAQKREGDVWVDVWGRFREGPAPFDWRSYAMFGFLADVRNAAAVPPISDRRGFPDDFFGTNRDAESWQSLHSASWLSVDELLNFDYDQEFEDHNNEQRICTSLNSVDAAEIIHSRKTVSYREYLEEAFFKDLTELHRIGAERIVFAFDS